MRVSLSEAKAKLSEYVRLAQEQGETITITVDQRPAAEIRAVAKPARDLTAAEILMVDAFSEKMCAEAQGVGAFNVLDLMEDVRR